VNKKAEMAALQKDKKQKTMIKRKQVWKKEGEKEAKKEPLRKWLKKVPKRCNKYANDNSTTELSSQVTEKAYQTQEIGITVTEGRIEGALTRKGEKKILKEELFIYYNVTIINF